MLLRPANVLHQRLLGVLGRDTAEANGRHLDLDLFAHLGVGLDPARVEHRDLVVCRHDPFRDHQLCESTDIAVFLIDSDAEFPRGTNRLFGGRQQSFVDRAHQDLPVDALFAFPKL